VSNKTALTILGSLLGHHGGDYLAQNDDMAGNKQKHTHSGRKALAKHAASYTLVQALTKAVLYKTDGVKVSWKAQLAGALTEGLLHAVIDDGRLLRLFAEKTGKTSFHSLADHGVNGRMLMDQAMHHQIQMVLGAVVTILVDNRASKR
jgi:hypothetical protein